MMKIAGFTSRLYLSFFLMGFYGVLMGFDMIYPLVMTNNLLLKMAIEIVEFPIKNGDFP